MGHPAPYRMRLERATLGPARQDHTYLSRWAFKDPRTLYTLGGWLERLPEMRFIASFRHPLAVARSLLLCTGSGDLDRYVALWTAYNHRLIEFHDRFGFDRVCFPPPTSNVFVPAPAASGCGPRPVS